MSLDATWDSFEERNLVLQGLLGLLSTTEVVAAEARARAGQPTEPSTPPEVWHPLVLMMLGMINVRDTLYRELEVALEKPLAVALTPEPPPERRATPALGPRQEILR